MGWGENANSPCQLGGEPGNAPGSDFAAAGSSNRGAALGMTRGHSTACVAVVPPRLFPSPSPVATRSAAHSQFTGRELGPPDPWPALSWDAGKYTWPPARWGVLRALLTFTHILLTQGKLL